MPTQIITQSQSQSQPAAPFTKASPAKASPFQKSAENRSAFLRAISRSPSTDRSQKPFTARGREREKQRERDNSFPRQQARSLNFEKPNTRDKGNQRHSQSFSQSYVTPGQRPDRSSERERNALKKIATPTNTITTVA